MGEPRGDVHVTFEIFGSRCVSHELRRVSSSRARGLQEAERGRAGRSAGRNATAGRETGGCGFAGRNTGRNLRCDLRPRRATARLGSLSLAFRAWRAIDPSGRKENRNRFRHADEYIKRADAYFEKNGFAEREIAQKAERYGNIMQIFSTYESRHDPKDAQPFARGINSFQLFYDGTRWWVVTIYWLEETPENPLPKEFLPATK